jgi:hypothetical protein
VEGQVTATPGAMPFTGAESGVWTAGSVNYESYDALKMDGAKVIHGASCRFSFSGQSSSGATVTGSETVTLEAGRTIVQKDSSGALLSGDSATGSYGNKLMVSGSGCFNSE